MENNSNNIIKSNITDKKEENENAEQGRESRATEGDNQSVQ